MKVSELSGRSLNWAVAKAEDHQCRVCTMVLQFSEKDTWCWRMWSPSTDWSQGGPIIEREKIEVRWIISDSNGGGYWSAWNLFTDTHGYTGPTPLIAAMRCYVASKMGDEMEIPKELLK